MGFLGRATPPLKLCWGEAPLRYPARSGSVSISETMTADSLMLCTLGYLNFSATSGEQRSPGCSWSLAVDKIYTLIAHSSTAEFSHYVAQLVMSSR